MDNPQAFPSTFPGIEYGDGSREMPYIQEGMTLRDYFAATAINGILSNEGRAGTPESILDDCSRAYQYADAMLDARNK